VTEHEHERSSKILRRKKVVCPGKYKQVGLSVHVARMSNGYGKSFPPVRALASIANATVHFRNADDLSRESPISSSPFPSEGRRTYLPNSNFLSSILLPIF